MKNTLKLVSLLMCATLCACSGETDGNIKTTTVATVTESQIQTTTTATVTEPQTELKTPMLFASHTFGEEFPQFRGKTLTLEMTEGVYDEEQAHWGGIWSGNFSLKLSDSAISLENLTLKFNEQFDINADDYNNDGNPDFAINNWGTLSGGSDCRLFSLTENGIKPLKVDFGGQVSDILRLHKEYNDVYSPVFEKGSDNTFSFSYFTGGGVQNVEIPLISHETIDKWFADERHKDSAMSEFTLRNIYEWKDDTVVLIRQEILEPNGEIWVAE